MKRGMAILCAAALIVLPGCWSRREPKDLAITSSILYDINDDGTFTLTTELMHPGPPMGGEQAAQSSGIIVTSDGDSLPEALRNAEQSVERHLFAAHIEVRFLTERFARAGSSVCRLNDFVMRDHITNMRPYLVVIRGDDPESIYESTYEFSENTGAYIRDMVASQMLVLSKGVFVTQFEFIRDYYTEGKEPVLGCIELVEDPAPSPQSAASQGGGSEKGQKKLKIIYEGLAAFKQGVLVGFMNGNEARVYNILASHFCGTYYSTITDGHGTVVFITDAKARIKTDVSGERPAFDIAVETTMTLIQESHGIDINDPVMIAAIEQAVSDQLASEIRGAIQKAQQEFGSDIFGFGAQIHRQHPHAWRQMKDGWADLFPTADVRVTVESCLERLGEGKEPFIREGS